MKTQINFLNTVVLALLLLFSATACRKNRHERRIERAINEKVGSYSIAGKIGDIAYTNETITVSKLDKTKILISGDVLPKTYSFE
jgi:hypothetical protein